MAWYLAVEQALCRIEVLRVVAIERQLESVQGKDQGREQEEREIDEIVGRLVQSMFREVCKGFQHDDTLNERRSKRVEGKDEIF
jgi:hypothetical protein